MTSSACKLPPELSEDQIDNILDGELSQEILHHLEMCHYCAQRVERARTMEIQIRSKLHPHPEDLIAYAESELPPPKSEKITFHLRHCQQCSNEIEAWQAFVQAIHPNLPEQTPPPRDAKKATPVRYDIDHSTLIAKVSYRDSKQEDTTGFDLRNEHNHLLISLRWYAETSRLTGFLIPEVGSEEQSWEGAVVVALQSDRIKEAAVVNSIGNFQLDNVAPGLITLSITAPDTRQFRIEDLALPPE